MSERYVDIKETDDLALQFAARILWHMHNRRMSIDMVNFIGKQLFDASVRAQNNNDLSPVVIDSEVSTDFRQLWESHLQSLMERARKGEPPFTHPIIFY